VHKLCCFDKVLCILNVENVLNVENDSDGDVINRTSSNLRNVEYIDMKINPIGLAGRLYTICKDYWFGIVCYCKLLQH